jgi:hypothetical protein
MRGTLSMNLTKSKHALTLLALFTALMASPSLAVDKAKCAANVEQFMKQREKMCEERLKKEPLQIGKCKEMLAAEKPKMLSQCQKSGKVKYERE